MHNIHAVNKRIVSGASGHGGDLQHMQNPLDRHGRNEQFQRASTVYNPTDIENITGRDQHGNLLSWGVQRPYFYLAVRQRNEIFKLCSPVQGVVSSRMKRMSGLDFNIVSMKKKEDEIADYLKGLKTLFDDYAGVNEFKYIMAKATAVNKIQKFLPDCLPDLRNFKNSLTRWKKRIDNANKNKGDEIKDWLKEPNQGLKWSAYIQKFVYNLLIHGADATYKQANDEGLLENFDSMLGGSVYRLSKEFFSAMEGYVQVMPNREPQIFFANEVSYVEHLATSVQAYPFIPLESLINKVSEYLMFDSKMANEADGTKPPEKLVVITNNDALGSGFGNEPVELPLVPEEQARLEQKMNEPKKNKIITFSGNGATVVDLSTQNLMQMQTARQKDIRDEVAFIFNATNMEMNMTGSEDTSGRSTSESQSEIDQGKGITPLKKQIQEAITENIIPYRFGFGYMFEFETGKNEKEDLMTTQLKQQVGLETINETREKEGLPTFSDEEFDKPVSGVGSGQSPDGSEMTPFNFKGIEG